MLYSKALICLSIGLVLSACGAIETEVEAETKAETETEVETETEAEAETEDEVEDEAETSIQKNVFASEVISFEAGEAAGFGMDEFPDVVLGPPEGKGNNAGSMDVLSLGIGGTITLGLGGFDVVDGPGPDFIVFENPFWVNNSPTNIWKELAEISVSEDGETWHTFPCTVIDEQVDDYGDCAGWRTVQAFEVDDDFVLDPQTAGGDAFDLADLGLTQIRFIRIHDLAESGATPSAGFDLDAIGAVNFTLATAAQ